jgi:hypothetical protein
VRVLVAVVVVLAVALTGVGVRVLTASSSAKDDVAALRSEAAARAKAKVDAQKKLRDDFDAANLSDKLQTVKDRTTAAGDALTRWATAGGKVEQIKSVRAARNTCDEAILDYNATAAQFPSSLLANLPDSIDLTNHDYNCGR